MYEAVMHGFNHLWIGGNKKRLWWLLVLLPFFIFFAYPLPDPLFKVSYSTVLEARDGTLLGARIAQDEQWRFPLSDSIPDKFQTCLRLYEDEFFFKHPGINPISLGKAFIQNVQAGRIIRGGSTLSMQVIRMALGNSHRTYLQKCKELLLALKLELSYSKNEILQLYASHAPFGSNVVGLSAASWRYYRKSPDALSWAECATLAVLPNSPSIIYPGKNEGKLQRKRNFLLRKLLAKGYLDSTTYQLALLETLPGAPHELPDLAPHLLGRAMQEGQIGKRIKSSLHVQLQALVAEKVARHHQKMVANHVYNAAALVVDVRTGAALAYVGNTNTNGDHGQYVDVITAPRSTGSLLKPILYGAALDEGILLPYQLLPDIPLFYQGFAPKNFDKKFYGAVPADVSLIRSLNVPFVFLLREYGYEKFHQKLVQMGLSSLNKPASYYGLSLILGGAESSLWEITAMYAGLVRTLNHDALSPHQKSAKKFYFPNHYLFQADLSKKAESLDQEMLNPSAIWHTFQAMQQVRRPEELAGWERFPSAKKVAWKTGTSFGFRDAWAVGLNDRYVVGVWLGNADGEGRPDLIGVKAAAPLLFDIFDELDGSVGFSQPVLATSEVKVCTQSGFLASDHCPHQETLFVSPKVQVPRCPYHQQLHLSQNKQYQVNSSCYAINDMISYSWFILPPVQAWYYRRHHIDYIDPPPFDAKCQKESARAYMEIIYPNHKTRLYIPRELDGKPGLAVFEVAHQDKDATLFWHLDDVYLGKTQKVHQLGVNPSQGSHTLHIVDNDGRELIHRFEVISNNGF